MRVFIGSIRHTVLAIAVGGLALPLLSVLSAVLFIAYHFQGTATLPADCAIVFGAAVYAQDQPGPALIRRTAEAADLYGKKKISRIIVSGGKGRGVRSSEAEVMQELAIDLGVRTTDIQLEDASHSTWENIANARNLTDECSSVVGISDGYHLARIALIAKRQGWTLPTVATTLRPDARSERRSIMREMLGVVYYAYFIDYLFPYLKESYSFKDAESGQDSYTHNTVEISLAQFKYLT